MKIGIIGTGEIGGELARHWGAAGHQLMITSRQAFKEPERPGIPLASDTTPRPAPVGGFARAREFDRGTPVYVRGMAAAELRRALGSK